MKYRTLIATLLALLLAALSSFAEIGGGITGGGLAGEYFANADLSGSPAFNRRELRLDFDWGTVLPIGGSNDPRYKNFPVDNFSARYTGKVIAAFTETYTFRVVADDGARLFIRPEGGSSWTTLIDQWSAAGTYTATSALVKGTRYEIKVEYRELTGTAALRLLWSSASTPEEVIDPVMHQGFNITYWGQVYADLAKSGRSTWEANGNGAVTQDANGWPQNDAALIIQETMNVGLDVDPLMQGVCTFSFKGRATVSPQGNMKATDGSNNLVYSYNEATNTTTGSFLMTPNGWNATYLKLNDTDREGQTPARKNGITDLKIMRPSTPGGTTPYPDGTIFIDQAREATSKFTSLRVNLNNANAERFWSDRTIPTFFNQTGGKYTNNYYTYMGGVDPNPSPNPNGASWEYNVMLANETGADLYINVPVMADGWSPSDTNSYVYKLAQLIRYGSDGVNPYTAPTANPVFPPLNPNLRVYVELSNEIWNAMSAAFRQYFDMNEMMLMDARLATGSPTAADLVDPLRRPTDFAIYNYDNLPTTKNANGYFDSGNDWRLRKIILRTVQISNIFRGVWGDANMGPRVRPLYEWQYENANSTASTPLKFINDYFNNGDGIAHVATPRPVNYYIWGGGGASYYGATNGYGTTDQLINPSFETPVVANGYNTAPSGATWTFTGNAGIARDAGSGDDIPPGWSGSAQCGYIAGTGSMSIQVTIPSTQVSNAYAFVFKAVNRTKVGAPIGSDGLPTRDTQNLQVYVNGVLKNWRSFNQANGYTPIAYDATNPWNSFVVFWTPSTPYYSSGVFTAAPGSTVTLRIEGTATADQIAFLEDVRLASVDKTFADGMPGGGEAAGQPAGFGYQKGLNIQASWALAYGLNYVTYEGGWSLGGDTGGTPLQNTGKFTSSDAAVANTKAINMFHQSGGYMNVYGTYSLWPNSQEAMAVEGLLNVSQYPLMYSQAAAMNSLPADPSNGVFLPNSLTSGNASLLSGGTGDITGRNWISWNAITTTTNTYTITINTGTGGTAQLWVDGVALGASFTTGGATTRTINLTKGIHGIRLQGISGSFAPQNIALSIPGAPAAPTITTITDGSGSKTIEWAPVSGATGYTIRWGTDKGVYLQSADVPSGTTKTLTGLGHDQTYYFVVVAYNAIGLSLPSPEVGSTALVDGLSGHLSRWEFAGNTGNEATVPPTSSTSRIVTTALARGPGLKLSTYGLTYTADSFAYAQNGSPGSTTAAGALTRGDYSEFSVTPKPGTTVSISSLAYAPYWQDPSQTTQGGGIAYSINGGAYTIATVTGTPSASGGAPLMATLSGIAALQNLTGTVTFRLLHPNLGDWSFAGIGRYTAGDDIVLMGSVSSDSTAAAPVISPNGGAFSASQSVTLSSTTAGATIRYTTDGSTPSSTSGTVYTGPFSITTTTTVKAIAYAAGLTTSSVSSANFTFALPVVSAPSFTPAAGTYAVAQSVAINSTTSGAAIRYTTDGSTPTSTTGTLYSTPVSVDVSQTLKAIAYKSGMTDSPVTSAAYAIVPLVVAPPVFSPVEGTYSGTQFITLSTATAGATIRYTTDGSTPTSTTGTVYSGTITVSATTTIKAIAYAAGMTDSTSTATFTIILAPITVTARGENLPNEGLNKLTDGNLSTKWLDFSATSWVNFSYISPTVWNGYAITSGNDEPTRDPKNWTISGSNDGTTWTALDTRSNQTWAARAQTNSYTFTNTTAYTYYKWDITANGSGTIIQAAEFTPTIGVAPTVVANPTFTPAAGTYTTTQSVTLSTTTAGASIRYTTDGSTPNSTTGTIYSTPVSVSTSQTLKAIAYKSGMTDSSVASATYTINQPTTYAVSYNANGSTSGSAPDGQTKTQGIPLTLASNSGNLAKTGYTFDGWNTAANGSGTDYAVGASYVTDAALVLYAKWTSASSNTLLEWTTFAGNSNTSSPNPTETAALVATNLLTSSGVLSRGAGFNPTGDQSYGPWTSNFFGTQVAANPANLAGSITANIYAAFTLTPAASYVPSVSAVSFYGYGLQSSTTAELLYSTDGFATYTSLGAKVTGTNSGTLLSYDTSAVAALQNATTPIAFRVYFYGEADSYCVRGIGGDPSNATPVLKVFGSVAQISPVTTPVFSPVAGTYVGTQSVTISTTTAGATIRYTTDGSTPTSTTGTVYSTPVSVSVSQTLKAIAYKSGMPDSSVSTAVYTINQPLIITTTSLPNATQGTTYSTTLAATGGTGTLTWSISAGSLPAGLSITTAGVISGIPTGTGTGALTAKVTDTNSLFSTKDLSITVAPTYVAAPAMSPSGGTYAGTQSVTISSGTSGATLKYTTDGSDPTSSGTATVYSGQVIVAANTTIKAYAYKSGLSDSSVTTTTYTIKVAAPTFSLAGGLYPSTQTITISSTTSASSIRYTTDGSTPTSSTGTLYSGAIALGSGGTLKAIAYKSGMGDSNVSTSGAYTTLSSLDIGGPTPAGSTSLSSGTWTVKGGGSDIWGTSDKFQYAYTDVSGNTTIIAKVDSVQNTNAWAKAGVMMRDGTAANARHVMVVVTPSNGVAMQYRTSAGGTSSNTQVTGITAPRWVKLVRSGNSFTGFYSSDGSTWTQVGGSTFSVTNTLSTPKAGLCVTSHAQGTLCTSTMSNVSITNP